MWSWVKTCDECMKTRVIGKICVCVCASKPDSGYTVSSWQPCWLVKQKNFFFPSEISFLVMQKFCIVCFWHQHGCCGHTLHVSTAYRDLDILDSYVLLVKIIWANISNHRKMELWRGKEMEEKGREMKGRKWEEK